MNPELNHALEEVEVNISVIPEISLKKERLGRWESVGRVMGREVVDKR